MIGARSQQFAAECEEIALERRGELGLALDDRLDPRRLAEEVLEIGVLSLEHFRGLHPEAVGQLTERDAPAFSAVTVFHGTRCTIIVNPSQSVIEEALSIAHEISHIELEHERLEAPLFDAEGRRRSWHPEQEAEAEYLARELLVPRSAVAPAMARFAEPQVAAAHFGVSPMLMRQRLSETMRPSLDPATGEGRTDGEPLRLYRLIRSAEEAPTSERPGNQTASSWREA